MQPEVILGVSAAALCLFAAVFGLSNRWSKKPDLTDEELEELRAQPPAPQPVRLPLWDAIVLGFGFTIGAGLASLALMALWWGVLGAMFLPIVRQ